MAMTIDPRLDIKGAHPIHYIKEHGQRAASWLTDSQDVGDAVHAFCLSSLSFWLIYLTSVARVHGLPPRCNGGVLLRSTRNPAQRRS